MEVEMRVQVARWGNSLGLRIPKEVAREAGLAEGMRVEVAAEDGRVVISRTRPRYRLEELLEGMTPEDMHAAFDWGPDLGREFVG
jgi:antitoxin MazE